MSLFPEQSYSPSLRRQISRIFLEVLALSSFINLLALGIPIFTLQVYDRVVQHAAINTLWGLAIGVVCVIVFDFILRLTRSKIMQRVALHVDIHLGKSAFHRIFSLPLATLENRSSNHWESIFRDVDTVRNTLSGAAAILIADLPFVILFIGIIAIIAKAVLPVVLVSVFLFVSLAIVANLTLRKVNIGERSDVQKRDRLLNEVIQGRNVIKALSLSRVITPMWEQVQSDTIETSSLRGRRVDLWGTMGHTLSMCSTLGVTMVGAVAIIDQQLTLGGLIAANILISRIISPFSQLVAQWRTYHQYGAAKKRLDKLFALPMESEETEQAVAIQTPEGQLKLEQVTFGYGQDEEPVLSGLDCQFPAYQIHGVVGSNGSGKTTLLKIAQGLYRPDDGRVLLDGGDIRQFSHNQLAAWYGYMPQENLLFSGSIKHNITMRSPTISDDDIIRAAQISGLHAHVVNMQKGYNTDVGEIGYQMSGGIRQKIALTRTLVGLPKIIIMDEPSSHIDYASERLLAGNLNKFKGVGTIIMATHSLLLLSICDTITMLEDRQVKMTGPADKMLKAITAPGTQTGV